MTGRVDYQRVSLARLRAMWADDRLTVAQIAAECGMSEHGIRGRAQRLGFPARRLGPKPKYSEADFAAMWHAGVSMREVAALFGVDRSTLSDAARRMGLPPRGSAWQPLLTLAQYREAELAARLAASAAKTRAAMQAAQAAYRVDGERAA